MCGIYGMVAAGGAPLHHPDHADVMARALAHRGPDGHARRAWHDALLGVTRLRVVDLDPRADQPFADPSGAVALACNGEVYNAAALRRRYADYPFRSQSDVEVILPLYLDRGPAGLADIDGMFAVAILDRRAGRLVLARDRAGEKPLFTARVGDEWWFASEIGALLGAPAVPRSLDAIALSAFLRHGYIREPATPFTQIQKVPASTVLTIVGNAVTAARYWDPVGDGPAEPAALDDLLRAAVARQVRADVPLGVFSSGGLDSSLLAVLAAEVVGPARLRTFAVGFPDRPYDERRFAARLAATLGMPHTSVEVADDEVPAALDALAATGEPIGDPAAVPTLVLARAARPSVTVVLSGEGADELFGGYPTYVGHRLAPVWGRLPRSVRRAARTAINALPSSQGRVPLEFLLKRFAEAAELPTLDRHLRWFANGLPPHAVPFADWSAPPPAAGGGADPVATALLLDYEGPLRERLLVKVDRATMRASLEARAPYLDPAVTRAALAAGAAHVRGVRTKLLLREVARRRLPSFILRRRKRGLSVPLGRWLNGPLAGLADRLLRPGRLTQMGLMDAHTVRRLLGEHRANRANHGRALWTVLVVQHWMAHWNLEIER
jgi:asparagine synthase (glutamine-hydrolysing)